MLRYTDLREKQLSLAAIRRALPRGGVDVASVSATVEPIVAAVRDRGAQAALDYGEKFDGVRPEGIRVPRKVCADAAAALDPQVRQAIEESIRRVRQVHEDQKPQEHTTRLGPGAQVTEIFAPIERVGLYVPGGKAVYPSSVIMNAVPAQAAGAQSTVVCSPPQKDHGGLPHPTILATCHILGVDEVWAVGGAQAVALLAYGDDNPGCGAGPLDPVDIITGPGNIFVTAAKRAVRGVVGTDAEAGPTEIAIIADSTANPVFVAYDLISQAEHDPMAASVLITDSPELAQRVDAEVQRRYQVTANAQRAEEALRGEQSGIVLVDGIDQAVAVANAYAAEHLEIHTADAPAVARRISHAGAIFVGEYSPVPLGDYSAGSNHVLPTSGTARFSAGLSTHTFLRPVNLIEYSREGLAEIAPHIINFADAEFLPAHGEAIRARFEGEL
ncbi:histidinol dehydrogenase [Corynebacterium phocae]|uniref:Histidinol dehydrogenase n=1 Tax=Corynebacterium phocae TaxID=161895 RepID=A0A1L7D282_9CORY|nr:histidinol dehydrogenase [Corynebacterium phocae]APT92266.1 histidinol dehydrogenase [Corynebacterium phocae]KAA8725413.1 histidinol dehydrogenase [Corynebacterium phocae]